MKVGLITFHTFSQPGGVKRHVLGLHQEFKKRGIESKIIVPRRLKTENYGKDVILLGTSLPLKVAGTQADLDVNFNPLAIDRVLKKEKFDVLHFHNFGFPSGLQILERSETLNVMTFHASLDGVKFFKTFSFILYILRKIVQWKMDGLIGVAPFNLEIFKKYKRPTAVIPNGIDLKEFNPKVPAIKKYLDDKINILFLGRIEERKGLIYLLKAYKILNKKSSSPLRLIVVGEGPLKEMCKTWTRRNKLEDVVFVGGTEQKDAPAFYASCDIYCSPAIYGESFGIVLIEAMATGKPVVAFANKGYKGVLEKGRGGRFLVKPRDYKTLAKKLETLIENKKLRNEMGRWGIKEAKKYSWPKIADQVLNFYELCRKNKLKQKEINH